MGKQGKLSKVDIGGILLLGGTALIGAPLLAGLLQFAALALGVLGILAVVWQRTIAAVLLFPSAWICWWLGYRLSQIVSAQPLDQTAQIDPLAIADEPCCSDEPAADEPAETEPAQ